MQEVCVLSTIRSYIPNTIKQIIKYYRASRYKARLFGELAPLIPAEDQMFDGQRSLEEFKANGEEFLKIYKDICGLQPGEIMLDVGCGIGRKTWALTQYLNKSAVYEGIDVTKEGIDWCREKFTPRYPNFHFQQIDVYNKAYNPQGKYRPADYIFPFEDETFSFVILGSVFTHMAPCDVEHYLSEIYRVLIKNGRCLITYFLLDDEVIELLDGGFSTLDFRYDFEKYRAISSEVPEEAIAFDRKWVLNLYENLGFKVSKNENGSWCGRKEYLSYQDMILAIKE